MKTEIETIVLDLTKPSKTPKKEKIHIPGFTGSIPSIFPPTNFFYFRINNQKVCKIGSLPKEYQVIVKTENGIFTFSKDIETKILQSIKDLRPINNFLEPYKRFMYPEENANLSMKDIKIIEDVQLGDCIVFGQCKEFQGELYLKPQLWSIYAGNIDNKSLFLTFKDDIWIVCYIKEDIMRIWKENEQPPQTVLVNFKE